MCVACWPLHNIIAITNIIWVYGINKGDRRGVAYCAMVVQLQLYCNRVGFAGGGSTKRMMDSHIKAMK